MTWDRLFISSRKEYLEFLAAMLHGADGYHNDSRIHDVMDFGGEETIELLRKMAQVNPDLKQLMDAVDRNTK